MHLLHLTQDFTVSAQHPIAHLFTKWRLLTQKTNLLSVGLTLWRSAPSAISSTILSYLVRHTKNTRKTRMQLYLNGAKGNRNVKNCPSSGYTIEKADGCNHVEYRYSRHICWTCLENSNTSDECYSHIRIDNSGRSGDSSPPNAGNTPSPPSPVLAEVVAQKTQILQMMAQNQVNQQQH